MNKTELIDAICDSADVTVSKKDISEIVRTLFNAIQEAVAGGDKVTIVGFGSFEKRNRLERQGRNPSTGESLTIPAVSVPVFSPGKTFKEYVSNYE